MVERIMTRTSKLRVLVWMTSSKECTGLEKNTGIMQLGLLSVQGIVLDFSGSFGVFAELFTLS